MKDSPAPVEHARGGAGDHTAAGNGGQRAEQAEQKNAETTSINLMVIKTLKRAYLKHHCDVESIGWEELDKELFNTLTEAISDGSFCLWLDEALKAKETE